MINKQFDKHVWALETLGNGDLQRGMDVLQDMAGRLVQARKKHPWPRDAGSMIAASDVVFSEAYELIEAAGQEGDARAYDEALDVLATATRFLNREWEHGTAQC